MNDLRDELNGLYFEAGAGLYASQALEYSLKYLIWLLSKEEQLPLSMQRADQILEGNSKETLGNLSRILTAQNALDTSAETALRSGLEARNDLVHRYFINNVERMGTADERETMQREVRSLRRKIQEADEAVRQIVERILPFHLLSFEQFVELLDQTANRGREVSEKNTGRI